MMGKLKNIGLLLICLFSSTVYGLQIDSVKTTVSTCSNNGSVSVYAKTSSAPLVYSIVTGPFVQPAQTSNFFGSLPPGNYVVKVADGSGASLMANAVITGTYVALDFNPVLTNVSCRGNTDGKIVGTKVAGTGYGPFTWQLVAPSPRTTVPQTSDIFTNLAPGNYTLRLTDACGNFRTKVVTITTPNTTFYLSGTNTIKHGCDSMFVNTNVYFNEGISLPMTLTYTTKNGSVTASSFEYLDSSRLRTFKQMSLGSVLKNITYGDWVQITARNGCGDTYTVTYYIKPFNFYPSYSYLGCSEAYVALYNNTNNMYNDGLKLPLNYTLKDVATNIIEQTGTIAYSESAKYYALFTGGGFRDHVTIGKTYEISMIDGCGQTFTQQYTIPAPGGARIVSKGINYVACIDSAVGSYSIETAGFATDAVLTITSGPTNLGSTKPEFGYQKQYTYPISIPVSSGGYFFLYNIPAGTYNFTITDGCNRRISSTITIKKTDLSSLSRSAWFKKGCLGKNAIYYAMSHGRAAGRARVTIKNIATGLVLSQKNYSNYGILDSLVNVASGQYEITFEFGGTISTGALGKYMDGVPHGCTTLKDTITIEGYQTPEIYTGNSILCHGGINLLIVPDSSKGVPPFQYEIISGPQAFPIQSSNIFTVTDPGIYVARIYDVCGNATAKQIYVSAITNTLIPSSVTRTCDALHLAYPSSIYYRYQWTRPNNTAFVSDSLVLDPILAKDTGWYRIAQITNINGCLDTLYANYHVTLSGAIHYQNATICAGQSFTLGSSIYTASGVYQKTFVNSLGCDSIVQLALTVGNYRHTQIDTIICKGQSFSVGVHTYVLPGVYYDTITTATCDSIVTLHLAFSSPFVALGSDTVLCQGESLVLKAGAGFQKYYWNNNYADSVRQSISVNQTGTYWVEVENDKGCRISDSLRLTVFSRPTGSIGNDTSICSGDKINLVAYGGIRYQWFPGGLFQQVLQINPLTDTKYWVVVYDAHGCKDTAEKNIHVHPAPVRPAFENELRWNCFDENSTMEISPAWGNRFLWNTTGDTSHIMNVTEPGVYEVKVFDVNGCGIKGSVTVLEYCEPKLFVPSAFSPNADGTNESLEIFGKNFTNFKITIFNRWGEIIFISTDSAIQWDGTYRGAPMEIGTYPWTIQYQSKYNADEKYQRRGSVTLIR